MPESCISLITLNGPSERIAELKTLVRGEKECFSLHKVIPMPDRIRSIGPGPVVGNIEQVFPRTIFIDPEELKSLNDEDFHDVIAAIKNVREYGKASWYDWSLENWGTKYEAWDCHEVGRSQIRITTALDAPYPIFEKLSCVYPDVTLDIKIASSTKRTPQYIRYNRGRASSIKTFEPNSEAGIRFSCDVLSKDFHGEVLAMREEILRTPRLSRGEGEQKAH